MDNIKSSIDNVQMPDLGIYSSNKTTRKGNWHWFQVCIAIVIKVALTIAAAYLALQCNQNEHFLAKTLIVILAVLFSEIYIMYYAFYRVMMGNKCPV